MKKNQIRENEIYRPKEFEKHDEFMPFPAEQYPTKEASNVRMENYESEEINKVCFTSDSSEKKKEEQKTLDDIKINTVAKSTSVAKITTSVMTAVGAGALGVVVIFNPVQPIVPPGESSSETSSETSSSSSEEEPQIPPFGSFNLHENSTSEIQLSDGCETYHLKNLFIYYDGEVNEGFETRATLTSEQSGDQVLSQAFINADKGYLRFSDVEISTDITSLDVNVGIYYVEDSDEQLVFESSNTFMLKTDFETLSEGVFEYLITFNQDDTTNAYFYNKHDEVLDENYIETVQILDKNGDILDEYDLNDIEISQDNMYLIPNIPYSDYTLANKVYYVENSSKCLVKIDEIKNVSINELDETYFNIVPRVDGFTMNTKFLISEDVPYQVTDLDSGDVYTDYLISESSYHGVDFYVDYADMNLHLQMELNISPYESLTFLRIFQGTIVGEFTRTYLIDETVSTLVEEPKLELYRFEIYEDDPYNYQQLLMYFKGHLPLFSSIQVDAIDTTGQIVETITSGDFSYGISFSNLVREEIYTFEYYLVDDNNVEIPNTRGSYVSDTTTTYTGLNVSFSKTNPGDIPITINDDYSYNAYFITNFQNNTEYDVYLQIKLDDIFIHTKEAVQPVYNLTDGHGVNYAAFIADENDPIKHYAIGASTNPSGVIGEDVERYYGQGSKSSYSLRIAPTESQGIYQLYFSEKILSDSFYCYVNSDNAETEPLEILISSEDISFGTIDGFENVYYFEIDLSNFTFDSYFNVSFSMLAQGILDIDLDKINQADRLIGKTYVVYDMFATYYI